MFSIYVFVVFEFCGDVVFSWFSKRNGGGPNGCKGYTTPNPNTPSGAHTAAPGLYSSIYGAVAVALKNTVCRL